MLTKEIIRAVLQGLPSSSLPPLGHPYLLFCQHIETALEHQVPPLPALKYALQETDPWGTRALSRSLKETRTIQLLSLPALPKRQKELLVALRVFGAATCAQLGRTLSQDRSHTHKRLAALIASGLVGKCTHWGGIFYFAIASTLPQSQAAELEEILERLPDTPEPVHDHNPFLPATPATTATSATTAANATSAMGLPQESYNIFHGSPHRPKKRSFVSAGEILAATPANSPPATIPSQDPEPHDPLPINQGLPINLTKNRHV